MTRNRIRTVLLGALALIALPAVSGVGAGPVPGPSQKGQLTIAKDFFKLRLSKHQKRGDLS